MKKKILVAVLAAAVTLVAGVAWVGAVDNSGLEEYRVVVDCKLGEVVDLFIPSLSGGKKFLPPNTSGLGLFHRWNPHLTGITWETPLQPGTTLRLPAEWVPRGIQGVVELVKIPQLNWNPEPMTGGESWVYVVVIGVCAGLIYTYVFGCLFRRLPCQPWRRI